MADLRLANLCDDVKKEGKGPQN